MNKLLRPALIVFFIVIAIVMVAEAYYILQASIFRKTTKAGTNPSAVKTIGKQPPGTYGSTESLTPQPIKTNAYRGIVTSINTKGGYLEKRNYHYDLLINLKTPKNNNLQLYFRTNELNPKHIIQSKNGQESQIGIADIKSGDNIIVEVVNDTTKPIENNVIDVNITVVK